MLLSLLPPSQQTCPLLPLLKSLETGKEESGSCLLVLKLLATLRPVVSLVLSVFPFRGERRSLYALFCGQHLYDGYSVHSTIGEDPLKCLAAPITVPCAGLQGSLFCPILQPPRRPRYISCCQPRAGTPAPGRIMLPLPFSLYFNICPLVLFWK